MVAQTATWREPPPGGVRGWAETLIEGGFVAISHGQLTPLLPQAYLADFRAAWDDLELDSALPDGGRYRLRRYGRLAAEVTAAGYVLEPLPHTAFWQAAHHVPAYVGRARLFAVIPQGVLLHPVMTRLVSIDLAVASASRSASRWEVGLHMVRIRAESARPGLPTPEGRHRDGHSFVGMHLLHRGGCEGGESVIYREGHEPFRLTLQQSFDSLIVDDVRLFHEATPITTSGENVGLRDILLVDLNVR